MTGDPIFFVVIIISVSVIIISVILKCCSPGSIDVPVAEIKHLKLLHVIPSKM